MKTTLVIIAISVLSACKKPVELKANPVTDSTTVQVGSYEPTPVLEEVSLPTVDQINRDIKPMIREMVFEGMGAHFSYFNISKNEIDPFEKDRCNVVVRFKFTGDRGRFSLVYRRMGNFWKLESRGASIDY